MLYFSPSANDGRGAFFDDAIFGPREIERIDEARQVAALTEARRKDDADYEAAKAKSKEPALILKAQFQERQKAVAAAPLMTMVANPDCRLPKDAIFIDDQEHFVLMEAQANGAEIVAGLSGLPMARARTVTAHAVLAAVRKRRDALLAASDWTQLADAPLTKADRALWRAHRAYLREKPEIFAKAMFDGMTPDMAITRIEELMPKAPEGLS